MISQIVHYGRNDDQGRKLEPKPGRKMGHLAAMADSADEAAELVRKAREALGGG